MSALVARLGWTLIHSLWEITLVWAAFQWTLAKLGRRSAQARYLAGCGALAAAVFVSGLTWVQLGERPEPAAADSISAGAVGESTAPIAAGGSLGRAVPGFTRMSRELRLALPWITLAWAAGCLGSIFRLAAGFSRARGLAESSRGALPEARERRCQELALRLGVRRLIRFGESAWVGVPCVIGWLKPVVLVPAGALAGLSPAQIDAVIAHELAHIRRHDFLVNLMQSATEAVFFYHPAIRSINRAIRREREHACDDVAVALTGDSLNLARALAQLEEARLDGLVLAATGGGDLLGRVRRLLGRAGPDERLPAGTAERSRIGPRLVLGLNCLAALLLLPLSSFGQNQPPGAIPGGERPAAVVPSGLAAVRAAIPAEAANRPAFAVVSLRRPAASVVLAAAALLAAAAAAIGIYPLRSRSIGCGRGRARGRPRWV